MGVQHWNFTSNIDKSSSTHTGKQDDHRKEGGRVFQGALQVCGPGKAVPFPTLEFSKIPVGIVPGNLVLSES